MTPQEYFEELTKHDWYYDYSDDHRVWTKGRENLKRIQAIAQEIPLFSQMYQDYSNWIFLPLDERQTAKEPKIKDYLV
tara:strand:+ start:1888 stop:2121 length:234 start_codon:yes stop_codon:yes gene_type:complete